MQTIRPTMRCKRRARTHACVRMTAIDAYQRDYDVIVAAECVASSDPEHHDITLRYLDGNIARILPTANVLGLIEALPNPPLQRT